MRASRCLYRIAMNSLPPPLWGRVGVGGKADVLGRFITPTQTLPHPGGGNQERSWRLRISSAWPNLQRRSHERTRRDGTGPTSKFGHFQSWLGPESKSTPSPHSPDRIRWPV